MSTPFPPIEPVTATLCSEGLTTRYRRLGVGRPLVLLTEDEGAARSEDLCRSLARRFRVIWPAAPSTGPTDHAPSSVAWLRGVIDALGLERCMLVAEGSLCMAAAWFVLADPNRVGRLVLLVPEALDASNPLDVIRGRVPGSERPLLLLRVDPGISGESLGADMVTRIVEFLEDSTDPL